MQLKLVHPKAKDPVVLEYRDGTRLLFSYEVPVAAYVPSRGFIATNADVSPTTHKRILDWTGDKHVTVDQSEIFAVITSRPVVTKEKLSSI